MNIRCKNQDSENNEGSVVIVYVLLSLFMFYFISDNNATKLTVIMIAIEPMRPMIAGLEFNENFLNFSF